MKILYIGNETPDTNKLVSDLASQNNTHNRGLITDSKIDISEDGYYHTSIVDLHSGDIIQNLAKKFDSIEFLEQPIQSYPNYKTFVTTLRLFYDLEEAGFPVNFKNKKFTENFVYWKNFLKENKSFCFYPFLALVEDLGYTRLCPKNLHQIDEQERYIDWNNNKEINQIRLKMIQGERILDKNKTCSLCYDHEDYGQESARQFETLEWAIRINASSIDDFKNHKHPKFYEIRPNNTCNIRCRTCDDSYSHLIKKEFKKLNFPLQVYNFTNTNFDKINFDTCESVYVGGGEPTVIPEFYNFLRKCISLGKTDFNLNIGTNGQKISETLLNLLSHFPKVCFAFSFDGFGKVNDYIRWGTDFNTVVENSRIVRKHGHQVSLQNVFSIYSLTRIHEVFQFYDKEFPNTGLLINFASTLGFMRVDPFNHPCPDLVIESMLKCQKTNIYFTNGRSVKTSVDAILNYYQDSNFKLDPNGLKTFFNFNDKLDASRNSKLEDYIPELTEARKKYNI
jgi:hypothetical protein